MIKLPPWLISSEPVSPEKRPDTLPEPIRASPEPRAIVLLELTTAAVSCVMFPRLKGVTLPTVMDCPLISSVPWLATDNIPVIETASKFVSVTLCSAQVQIDRRVAEAIAAAADLGRVKLAKPTMFTVSAPLEPEIDMPPGKGKKPPYV